jgi:hypothetical protein
MQWWNDGMVEWWNKINNFLSVSIRVIRGEKENGGKME